MEPEEMKLEDLLNDILVEDEIELDTEGLDALFEETLEDEDLTERSIMKLDKRASLRRDVSARAIQIAKEKNKSMYAKYKKALALKNKLEILMVKKYKSLAIRDVKAARKAKK